jgi:hypothetical protein
VHFITVADPFETLKCLYTSALSVNALDGGAGVQGFPDPPYFVVSDATFACLNGLYDILRKQVLDFAER